MSAPRKIWIQYFKGATFPLDGAEIYGTKEQAERARARAIETLVLGPYVLEKKTAKKGKGK
jgi:hypothetical protein